MTSPLKLPFNLPSGTAALNTPVQKDLEYLLGLYQPGYVQPEWFGAQPNNPAFDSGPAINAAIAYLYTINGGVLSFDGSATYYLGETIYVDPTQVSIYGNGCTLSWTFKAFGDPNGGPNLVTNGNFASPSGWTNGISNVDSWVITGGQLTHDNSGSFGQIGQQIATVAGQLVRVNLDIEVIDTVIVMSNTFRYVNILIYQNGVGSGPSGGCNISIKNTDQRYANNAGNLTIDLLCPYDNGYLTFNTNNGVLINSVEVLLQPDNFMMFFQVPSDGSNVGAEHKEISDLFLEGNITTPTYPIACSLNGQGSTTSIRGNYRNVSCRYSGIGWDLHNNCFLAFVTGGRTTVHTVGIRTQIGAINSGENIAFRNHTIESADVGVQNWGGFSIALWDTSIDFTNQWIDTEGGMITGNPWLEMHTSDITANTPLINNAGGRVDIQPKVVQVDGNTSTPLIAPFTSWGAAVTKIAAENLSNLHGTQNVLASPGNVTTLTGNATNGNATFVAVSTTGVGVGMYATGYGIPPLTTVTSFDAGGNVTLSDAFEANVTSGTVNVQWPPGQFDISGKKVSSVETISQRDPLSNLLYTAGDFEESANTVLAWLGTSVTHFLQQNPAQLFYLGSPTLTANLTSDILVGSKQVAIGCVSTPLTSADVIIDGYLTTFNPVVGATTTGNITTANLLYRSPVDVPAGTPVRFYGSGVGSINSLNQIFLANDFAMTGVQSLGITKGNFGTGTDLQAYIAYPIPPERNEGGEFWWLSPSGQGAGNVIVFFDVFVVRLQTDADSIVPLQDLTSRSNIFDASATVSLSAGQTWTRVAYDTISGGVGITPPGATHIMIRVGLESAPADYTMRIDGILGTPF